MLHIFSCYYYFKSASVSHDGGILSAYSIDYYISLGVLYSCCAFYYFYGKIFYDFPFSYYTYTLCLIVISTIKWDDIEQVNNKKKWYLLCGLVGFCLSWKPYNIFMIAHRKKLLR